ncbi:MAG TPA: septal ring lytic transglycosylase RlpA family protein [Alphaproteobacteria bacterium]|nr:septal ring lytic transglycosylase RlpA family protein [Alphaproteobacteria bacterium]
MGSARRRGAPLWLLLLICGLSACTAAPPPSSSPAGERPSFSETGTASWYGRSHQGRKTASGEAFDMRAMTAAHPSLPFGTVVRVTNLANGRMVKVRVNDRGPYGRGRVIDLSAEAAQALGMTVDGTAQVRIEVFASDQPGS